MNIIVIGCGSVGISLCERLSAQGHAVSVVSDNAEVLSNLSADFNGYTNVGVAIDQDVLMRAGIENCDALAAVTADDNINLMVSQIAKKIFNVPRVYARVKDPKKNEVFSKMDIETICPTNLTVHTLASMICETETSVNASIGNHSLLLTLVEPDKNMIGCRISELVFDENEVLVAIEHGDEKIEGVFLKNYELVKGDKLVCARFID